ncbi:MAG: hypothetical protein ABIZ09_02850, partial [Rhodoferax sp.]
MTFTHVDPFALKTTVPVVGNVGALAGLLAPKIGCLETKTAVGGKGALVTDVSMADAAIEAGNDAGTALEVLGAMDEFDTPTARTDGVTGSMVASGV